MGTANTPPPDMLRLPSLPPALLLAALLALPFGGGAFAQAAPAGGDPPSVRAEEGGQALRYEAPLGAPTASGEPYDPARLTVAHASLPFGTLVEVVHPGTGRSVRARVNDRDTGGALVRVSQRAADQLGLPPRGAAVSVRLDPGEVAFLEEQARRLRAQQRAVAPPPAAAPREAVPRPGVAGFTVQVGSFSEESRARARAGEIRGAWVLPVQLGERRVWRVCYGVYPERPAAAAAQAELAARGVEGFVKALVPG